MRRPDISFGFCAVICVLAWLDWRFCLQFLLCALCHELGHLACIALCRVKVRGISFTAAGAVIDTCLCDSKTELLCAAAGPAMGIVLGFTLLRYAPRTAMISFLLSVVNLLPLYPLDGGRMLRALLSLRFEEDTTGRILRYTTVCVCCLLMLLACWGTVCLQMGLWPIFAALVLLWRAGE